MARIRIDLPEHFAFKTSIPIRVTDLNYGGHVGNDRVLSLIHEARVQFLTQLGYSEFAFAGAGLIMADAGIEFKNELFYGETVIISVACANYSKVSFDVFYKLEKVSGNETTANNIRVANAKTTMACYDYANKKIISIPKEALLKLQETSQQ
jgi:acyl-CoA thioester hydrolase